MPAGQVRATLSHLLATGALNDTAPTACSLQAIVSSYVRQHGGNSQRPLITVGRRAACEHTLPDAEAELCRTQLRYSTLAGLRWHRLCIRKGMLVWCLHAMQPQGTRAVPRASAAGSMDSPKEFVKRPTSAASLGLSCGLLSSRVTQLEGCLESAWGCTMGVGGVLNLPAIARLGK